jgi:hypothetical protein
MAFFLLVKNYCRQRRLLSRVALVIIAVCLVTAIWFLLPTVRYRPGKDPALVRAARDINEYEIKAKFDPEAKSLSCSQRVIYRNNSGRELTHLYFHLYANAFKYEERPVFPPDEMERAYPKGFSSGFIDILGITVNDVNAYYILGGYSEDIMMIILNEPLKTDDRVSIEFDYTVWLPNCLGRFGYGDNTIKAANWYPIASVYDDQGWHLNRYHSIGDPFYSDIANYRVTLDMPDDYVIASTGDILKKKKYGGGIRWEIEAEAVRDFVFLAGTDFKVSSVEVDGTRVNSYYFTDTYGLKALDYAANAIKIFNRIFGKYPYRQFSVVESDFYIGGMEYPNLVMIDHNLYNSQSLEFLEIVTVHETAHQWWYGLVGNNQVDDAWLDEALTEYSTVLYYGHRYGLEKEQMMYEGHIAGGKYGFFEGYMKSLGIDETIHRPTYEFPDWITYDILVYGKGAMMFHTLRLELGDEVFYKVLQEYFKRYRFKNTDKEGLIGVLNEYTGRDWTAFLEEWLYFKIAG